MIAPKAVDLILDFEGLDQPGTWPGEQSGITLGHGYDLGYCSFDEFRRDWAPHLSATAIATLKMAIGKKAGAAKRIAPAFRDIHVSRAAARVVFESATLPKWTAQTRLAFPGCELLPELAFGALVSLVFNRGGDTDGSKPRRKEMASIRSAVQQWAALSPTVSGAGLNTLLLTVAAQIRSMKRLWVGKGVDGLLRRREAEAQLVERARV
jgi:GH24 family phage-related lysozyme (muramidase)